MKFLCLMIIATYATSCVWGQTTIEDLDINTELTANKPTHEPQNIEKHDWNDEEYLCTSRTRVIYPGAALNKDGELMQIVNTAKYRQGIRIEECINEGSTCDGLMFANGYTATCKQAYIYHPLVAFGNETFIRDQFKIPSHCKCVLKRTKM